MNSSLNVASLERQVMRQVYGRANIVAQQVFFQAQNALSEAATAGNAPASDSPADLRAYVRDSLAKARRSIRSSTARSGYSSFVYEVTIVDYNGTVADLERLHAASIVQCSAGRRSTSS